MQAEIGLGLADRIVRLSVLWPGSQVRQQFDSVEMDRAYLAVEGKDALEPITLPRIQLGGSGQHHHSDSP